MRGRHTSPFCRLVLASIMLTACQVDNSVQGYVNSRKANFQNTEIIVGSPVEADGVSQFVVAIHLKNANNTVVSNYKPTYTVSSAVGVTTGDCTMSDTNGVSVCILKSTVPGTKVLTLTNAKVGLQKNIQFLIPNGRSRMALASGAQMSATTPQGSRVKVSLGDPLKGARIQTSGGYKVTLSVQGAL